MTTPKTITMANLRRSGGDAFMDVATNRTRYVVTSHRRPLVAVVPLEDLERLDDVDRCYELLGDAAYVDGERVTLPEALAGLVNVASKLMEVKP